MRFILGPLASSRKCSQQHRLLTCRTLMDTATNTSTWIRDRGLDHAVERERNLKSLLNVKNFIKEEPSKSLPISVIAEKKESLQIPIRPMDFIRRYPSVFEEFRPGGSGIYPHVRLTPEVLHLDAEEQSIYQNDTYRQQAAIRLLKLLMVSRINEIPLSTIDQLRWDLGLPQDYVNTIVPEFPDYFRVSARSNELVLELVCYSSAMATSVLENKARNSQKGVPIAFPMSFSRGFEMDKKWKKWIDGWQKLPYISPYENALHLPPKSDESDKWAVAVMHELLHTFVPKKIEKEDLLYLGEYLGLRSRFKRALINHPGIFYVSRKIGTYTVVLREGFKRGVLVDDSPLMNMRSQYIHLMNVVKDPKKDTAAVGTTKKKSLKDHDSKGERGEDDREEAYNSSSSEVEDAEDNYEEEEESDDESDEGEEDEDENCIGTPNKVSNTRGRLTGRSNLNRMPPVKTAKYYGNTKDKDARDDSRKTKARNGRNVNLSSSGKPNHLSSWGRSSPNKRSDSTKDKDARNDSRKNKSEKWA